MSDVRRFVLSPADMASCFDVVGRRPEPVPPFDELPEGSGPLPDYLRRNGGMLDQLDTLLAIILEAKRTAVVEMFAPARGEVARCQLASVGDGRWVVYAYYRDSEEFDLALLDSADEMLVTVTDLTGIPIGAVLESGFSVQLGCEGLAVLAAIGDLIREHRLRGELKRRGDGPPFLGLPLDPTELHRIIASGLDAIDPRWSVSLYSLLTLGELANGRELDAIENGIRQLHRARLVDEDGIVQPEGAGLAATLAFPVCATRIVTAERGGSWQRLFYVLTDNMLICGDTTEDGQFLLGSVEADDAVRALRELLKVEPPREEAPRESEDAEGADELFEEGDYLRAARGFQSAIRSDPENAGLHVSLGFALRSAGELAAARKAFARALEIDLDDADAVRGLAWVEYDEGEIEVAEERFEGLCNDYPDEAEHHVGYALTLLQFPGLGRASEARDALKRAIACDPDDPGVYLSRATMQLQLGEAKAALRDATRSLELDADNAWAVIHRAQALHLLGKQAEALRITDSVIDGGGVEDDDARAAARLTRARVRIAGGDLDRAEEDLRDAREWLQDNEEADFIEGLILRQRGDLTGALAAFTSAIDQDPIPEYFEARADALCEDGKLALAAEDLGHAEAILRQADAAPEWHARIDAKLEKLQGEA